jgi:hypothetical protein
VQPKQEVDHRRFQWSLLVCKTTTKARDVLSTVLE